MVTESGNQPPIPPQNYQPNVSDVRQMQTARSLITFVNIAGPISLLFGGMLLSGIGLICGFVARRKLNTLSGRDTEVAQSASDMKRTCRISLIICGIAFAINAVCAAFAVSAMLGMIESGEFAEIVEGLNSGSISSSSTWG